MANAYPVVMDYVSRALCRAMMTKISGPIIFSTNAQTGVLGDKELYRKIGRGTITWWDDSRNINEEKSLDRVRRLRRDIFVDRGMFYHRLGWRRFAYQTGEFSPASRTGQPASAQRQISRSVIWA